MEDYKRICFDLSGGHAEALKELARAKGVDVSTFVNMVVGAHLGGNITARYDRRRFPRKEVLIPAMIHTRAESDLRGKYSQATVIDLSLGGLCISLPHLPLEDIRRELTSTGFEILFTIMGQNRPVSYSCRTRRILENANVLQVGASFQAMDTHSLTTFHRFMQQCEAV